MENLPKVSILVPIYGVENYIKRCAESIFKQNYENLEIIFVNDCTHDKSIEILESVIKQHPTIQTKVSIINHKQNTGLSGARHTALVNATGEYVMHVDSDDWLEPNCISEMISLAVEQNADMVVGDYYHSYNGYRLLCHNNVPDDIHKYAIYMAVRANHIPYTMCMRLTRRTTHLKVLPTVGLNFGEDYVTLPRLVEKCKTIVKYPKPCYNYWQENVNSSIKNINFKSYSDIIHATEILSKYYLSKQEPIVADIIKSKNRIFLVGLCTGDLRISASKLWPESKSIKYFSKTEIFIHFLMKLKLLYLVGPIIKYGSIVKKSINKIRKNKLFEC